MLNWDRPTETEGAYGVIDAVQYIPPMYVPSYSWQPTGGMVTGNPDLPVYGPGASRGQSRRELRGRGQRRWWLLRARRTAARYLRWGHGAEGLCAAGAGSALVAEVDFEVSGTQVVELGDIELIADVNCPWPGSMDFSGYRKVSLSGSVTVRDHEWFTSDVVDTFDLADIAETGFDEQEVILCMDSPTECPSAHTFSYKQCVGGEVRVWIDVTAQLDAMNQLLTTSKGQLLEGVSCQTKDLDDTSTQTQLVLEGMTASFEQHLINEDWLEDDSVDLTFELVNEAATIEEITAL